MRCRSLRRTGKSPRAAFRDARRKPTLTIQAFTSWASQWRYYGRRAKIKSVLDTIEIEIEQELVDSLQQFAVALRERET